MSDPKIRVAYVIARYPAVSHAFIQREVLALRALGADVETCSVRPAPPSDVLTETDRAEAKRTWSPRLLPLVLAHLRALVTGPHAYASTFAAALRLTPGGPRGLVRQIFYFAVAIGVWARSASRGITHLHAHLPNAAADIAHLAAAYGNARGGAARWRWSITMHSTPKSDSERRTLPAKLAAADLVVCASEAVRAENMLRVESGRWNRLVVVHCGVDTALFSPGHASSAAGPLRLLTVGRLVPLKAQSLLLQAVAQLGDGIELEIVGDGPLRGALEQEAGDLGISDRVTFAGAVGQDQIRSHYARADVFVLPSLTEGTPVVLMEAMAMEIPVVATRVMGVPELVEDGVSGYVVSPGRADLLASAIRQFADDPDRRAAFGRAGRARVQGDYELATCAEQLAEAFAR